MQIPQTLHGLRERSEELSVAIIRHDAGLDALRAKLAQVDSARLDSCGEFITVERLKAAIKLTRRDLHSALYESAIVDAAIATAEESQRGAGRFARLRGPENQENPSNS